MCCIMNTKKIFHNYCNLQSEPVVIVPEPFPKRQNFDSFKLKKFADDNLKYVENGRKLSIQVKNTVGKGEIARYEPFLLFPQCFFKKN